MAGDSDWGTTKHIYICRTTIAITVVTAVQEVGIWYPEVRVGVGDRTALLATISLWYTVAGGHHGKSK